MIKPEDEVVKVTDKSCTKDEIVAKLLGWMQGSARLASVRLNQYKTGVVAEHLPYMQTLEFPVNDQLIALRHEAQGNLYALAKRLKAAKKAKDEANYNALALLIEEKDAVIDESIVLMEKEAQYRRDVEDEIDNGATSAFEYYPPPPENPNEPRYTIKSVDQWSLNKYGLSVIDFANSDVRAERFRAQNAAVVKNELTQQSAIPADNKTWNQINLVQTQLTVNQYSTSVVDLSIPPSDIRPWDTPNPLDPAPKEEWYPAARYLARKYIADHPGLSIKKQKIAVKVAELMTAEKIVHSGNTPYSDRTVRKAFSRVKF